MKPITKKQQNEVIKDIRENLRRIQKEINKRGKQGFFFGMQDLLCRVGELESCLLFNFDHERNPENAKPRPNRLCTCYDRDCDDYERDCEVCEN